MSINYNALAIPKGPSRKKVKARKDREDAKELRHFRNLVWSRESERSGNFAGGPIEYARCQSCGALVARSKNDLLTGEVHHRIGRRHKATRYDPENGVLLCNHLVNNCHAKAEHGDIQV